MVWGMHWSIFIAWVVAAATIVFSFLYLFLAKKDGEDQ